MPYSKITEKEIKGVESLAQELISIKQVAYLFDVTERTVNNWIKDGKIKGAKIGGKWRFTKSEVERFIRGE